MWHQKILRGITIFSAVWILRLGTGLLTSACLYRYFGPSLMGLLAVGSSVLGLISFIVIETDVVVVPRLAGSGSPQAAHRIVWSNYLIKAVCRLLVGLLMFAVAGAAQTFYGFEGLREIIVALGIVQIVGIAASPIGPEVLQGLLQYRRYLWQAVLMMAAQIGAAAYTILTHQGVIGYILCGAVGDLVVSAYNWGLYAGIRRTLGWKDAPIGYSVVWSDAISLTQRSIPVSLNQILYKSYLNMGTLFAGKWFSTVTIGHLSFALNVVNKVNSAVNTMVSTAFLPVFGELKERARNELEELYERGYHTVLLLTAVATVLLAVFARQIALLLGGPEYLPAATLLQLLTVQLIFRVPLQILRMLYLSMEKTWTLLAIFFVKSACEIVLFFSLAPWLGAKGIVLAQVLSYVVYAIGFGQLGLRFLYADRYLRQLMAFGRDLIAVAALVGGAIAVNAWVEPSLAASVGLALVSLMLASAWLWLASGQKRIFVLGR